MTNQEFVKALQTVMDKEGAMHKKVDGIWDATMGAAWQHLSRKYGASDAQALTQPLSLLHLPNSLQPKVAEAANEPLPETTVVTPPAPASEPEAAAETATEVEPTAEPEPEPEAAVEKSTESEPVEDETEIQTESHDIEKDATEE